MRVLQYNLKGIPYGNGVIPGISGFGDTAPMSGRFAFVGNLTADAAEPDGGGTSFYLRDYVGGGNRLRWEFNTPPYTGSVPLSTYSVRFYYKADEEYLWGSPQTLVKFYNGPNRVWWHWLREAVPFQDVSNQLYIGGESSGAIAGPTTARAPYGHWWRVEIQVNENATPKVTTKMYLEEATTPTITLTANPTSVVASAITFGDDNNDIFNKPCHFKHLEIHDDYNFGGAMPGNAQYVTGQMTFEEHEAGELELEGVWNGTTVDATDYKWLYDDKINREVMPPAYTPLWDDAASNHIVYASEGRYLILFTPEGEPPEGGWPTIVYTHGGFFIFGSPLMDLSQSWLYEVLRNGFAVATVDYILSTIDHAVNWPDSAKYPEWFIDYKLAAKFLQTNAATYNLNPNQFIASGFSAGAHIALASAASRNLTDDGSGRNLTIRGNTALGGYDTDDPEFIGAYTFATPIDMQIAYDYDPTHPDFASLLWATCRAYMGVPADATPNLTNTGIPNMILRNGDNCCHLAVNQGESDYLINWQHADAFAQACSTMGVPYTVNLSVGSYHDYVLELSDYRKFINWAKDRVREAS